MSQQGESSDPWVNSLHLRWFHFRNHNSFFSFLFLCSLYYGACWTVRFVWCWSFCLETQEIGEEGLLNRDSGTQKVAEPACRGWGCQRRQLRGHHASPNHGKASAFPRGHYPYQGYILNPFLSFPLRFPSWVFTQFLNEEMTMIFFFENKIRMNLLLHKFYNHL